jgi:hypothetical protein
LDFFSKKLLTKKTVFAIINIREGRLPLTLRALPASGPFTFLCFREVNRLRSEAGRPSRPKQQRAAMCGLPFFYFNPKNLLF